MLPTGKVSLHTSFGNEPPLHFKISGCLCIVRQPENEIPSFSGCANHHIRQPENLLARKLFANQLFQRRQIIAHAQHRPAQQFRRRAVVGKERHHRVRAVIQRARVQLMLHVIHLQHVFRRNILALRIRLQHLFCQNLRAFQAQIPAMRRNRVHPHRRIAHQSAARADKRARVRPHQRIMMHRARNFHLAQATVQHFLRLRRQSLGRQIQQFVRFRVRNRNHAIGQMLFQRQQRQRAPVKETLARRVLVGNRVFRAEHNHRAPKIVHIRRNAQLAARLRETAVRRNQQARRNRIAVFQLNQRAVLVRLHAFHAHAATQFHILALRHFLIRRAANIVIRNQIAQAVSRPATRLARLRKMQSVIARAVKHLRIAQTVNLVFRNALPHSQALHNLARQMRQRNLPPVIRRILQRFQRRFLNNHHPQTAVFELPRKRQTSRATAHNQNIGIHNVSLNIKE